MHSFAFEQDPDVLQADGYSCSRTAGPTSGQLRRLTVEPMTYQFHSDPLEPTTEQRLQECACSLRVREEVCLRRRAKAATDGRVGQPCARAVVTWLASASTPEADRACRPLTFWATWCVPAERSSRVAKYAAGMPFRGLPCSDP